ncbi:MAG TPA: iron uptake system protein EfeO [Acidimicrobiia bacterium]|jgi:iron uptake system component EfeO
MIARTSASTRRSAGALLLVAVAGASLAACGSSSTKSAGSTGASTGGSAQPRTANVVITAADGCKADHVTFPAGALTFQIQNRDATAVSEVELLSGERIVGEKENLPPGFGGSFAVQLDGGAYTMYCPGATKERTTLRVTGKAPAAAHDSTQSLLDQGTSDYAAYVTSQVGYLVSTAQALNTALQGTDLQAAQNAYMKARPYYEKIEPVAESFTVGKDNLDADIDARAGDVPAAQWKGFHRIEQGLFQDRSLNGLAPFGAGLVTNVEKLQSLTHGLTYKPFELANGAQDLLDEVASSKITGEEERYSHIDLLDFQANDEGAQQAFADLQRALTKIDPGLTQSITSAFGSLNQLVDSYRTGTNASGFELYTQLTTADKQKLAAAVKAVQEPLSQVASKVANG